ncbi:hypothetical protein AB1K32_07695 [Metabacillus dongyingensis]
MNNKRENENKLFINKNPKVHEEFKKKLEDKFPEEVLIRWVKEIHKQY